MCFLRIAWVFWPCAILVARTDKAVQTFANSVTAITLHSSCERLMSNGQAVPADFLCVIRRMVVFDSDR
jgi:hypothetical protein